MDLLTGIEICVGLLSGGFALTKYFKDEEEKAKSKEAGTDPETLAKKQLDLAESTSTENLNLQKEQFEYQKELNNLTMQREDTAMQRQVADLKAAGLSPLMLQGGASANPLTSATAPQRDVSGINQAIGNFIGAYNDSYNRKMMRNQFNLQSMVSTAEAYTKLSELSLQKKKANFENAILSLDYKYYKEHPERNLGLQQILANIVSDYLNRNPSAVTPDTVKEKVSEVLHDSGLETPSGDFRTYGGLDPDTKYAHNFDNVNYDNNRATRTLIAEETKEKFYKSKLKKNDTEELRKKLYNTDDYLKKHISLDNWLKKDKDFISFYLKYGKFEGHKKYFE